MSAVGGLRARLEAGILRVLPDAFALGAAVGRLPTTLNVCLPGIEAEDFVDRMAAENIAISAGSACSLRSPSAVVRSTRSWLVLRTGEKLCPDEPVDRIDGAGS